MAKESVKSKKLFLLKLQVFLWGLGGTVVGVTAIIKYLVSDKGTYDSKMDASLNLVLIGFLGLFLLAISGLMYLKTLHLRGRMKVEEK